MVSTGARSPGCEDMSHLHDLFSDEGSTLIVLRMSRIYPFDDGCSCVIRGLREHRRDGKLFDDAVNLTIPRVCKLVSICCALEAVRIFWR